MNRKKKKKKVIPRYPGQFCASPSRIWRCISMALNSGTCRELPGGLSLHGGDLVCGTWSQHSPYLWSRSGFYGQMCHYILQIFLTPVGAVGTCSSPWAAQREVGTQSGAAGCSDSRFFCADLKISSGKLLPEKLFFMCVMCPTRRERQKIMLLTIFISSKMKLYL